MSHKPHYSRFLTCLGDRLHVAAHSHHPWPDCAREATVACWDEAARSWDGKWEKVMGEVLPAAQRAVADALRWPDPSWIAFAPNTHELVARLLSCLPPGRPRILTTDSEFHSFARQAARLEEDGAAVDRVAVEPIGSFAERFCAALRRGGHDFVLLSQVFYNSGWRLSEAELELIAAAAPERAIVVVDGYHAFMAVPLDYARLSARLFFTAGGYKYAQAGEGACFLAVPPGCALRPSNTGWFADFAALESGIRSPVGYAEGALRFWGATFDPAGLYRLNAVSAWRRSLGLIVEKSDAHVRGLQRAFLARLSREPLGELSADALVSSDLPRLGHFLTFRVAGARAVLRRLESRGVLADARGDRLRVGFGLYHDPSDIDELFARAR